MSYILEALRKSDLERRAGALTGLPATTYVVAPENPPGRRGGAILGALAMLGAGLGLGAWQPWRETPLPEPAPAVAAAVPMAPAVSTPASTAASTAVSTAVSPAVLPPPELPAPVSDAPPAAEALQPPAEPEKARPKPLPRTKGAAGPRREAAVRPVAEASEAAELPPPGMGILSYEELPGQVRDSLPPIAFGGYAGTGEGERRIAFINRRLVKEGEEVSPGVRLEEAGPQGVVLGYRGYRFRPGP